MLTDPFDSLLAWLFTRDLGYVVSETNAAQISRSWIDEWLLGKIIAASLQDLGANESTAWRSVGLVKLLIEHGQPCDLRPDNAQQVLEAWLADGEVQRFIGVNRYQGILWFNKEAFEEWLWWMFTAAVINLTALPKPDQSGESVAKDILACYEMIRHLIAASEAAGYQVEKLIEAAG